MSSGSKKKEPRYVYLSEAKATYSHKMWTEDSSPVPHFLQMGLSNSPIICRCLLKVLCLVSRPITTLDWVLLRDNNLAPVARLGPEINSWACLCVLQGRIGGVTTKNNRDEIILPTQTPYEDRTHRVFWNFGIQNSDTGESPKRKNKTFRTWRKFEIQNNFIFVEKPNVNSQLKFQKSNKGNGKGIFHVQLAMWGVKSTGWSKSLCSPDDYNTERYK
jgi:hypothetical protein